MTTFPMNEDHQQHQHYHYSSQTPATREQRILCCECGIPIEPNNANMCMGCLRSKVDISEGIPKQIVVSFCRGCDRYLQPPTQWLYCELESKELLALLLKRIKGLNKVRLIDAGFIWTEPHSKRLKVKLTIQKEVFANTVLQQSFPVEAIIAGQQCMECARREAKNTWNTVVQVRQKADHKRTFLYLEQLILKHQAHKETCSVKAVKDGVDFYFAARSPAIRFCDFLNAVVPVRCKSSDQLLTNDIHSGESTYKFTFSVEIVPVVKDDLVCLPSSLCRSLGGISPLVLCMRVGTSMHLMDPSTCNGADFTSQVYWRAAFPPLLTSRSLIEFTVLDVEIITHDSAKPLASVNASQASIKKMAKQAIADITVARSSDLGKNDKTTIVRSHLGNILKPGDVALGYDISSSNLNNTNFSEWTEKHSSKADALLPEVVLVRKSYEHLRRIRSKNRNWQLKQMAIDDEGAVDGSHLDHSGNDVDMRPAPGSRGKRAPANKTAMVQDLPSIEMERFMEDLEEDEEMRSTLNLYKKSSSVHGTVSSLMMVIDDDDDDDTKDLPSISIEELLDDLKIDE